MNRLVKILVSAVIFSIAFSANAQKIEFDEITHDFGEISEELGTAVHSFTFTNKGNKPLVITNVAPACGCTVADWTKEPRQEGESGTITTSYRTTAGPFNKKLTVISNGSPHPITLYIKGNVLKKPEDLKATHTQTLAKLNAKNKRDVVFPQINSQQTSVSQAIDVANITDGDLNISFENVPEHVVIAAVPPVLPPNKKGQITFSISGEKAKTFGFHNNEITVKVNDSKEKIKITDIVAEKMEATDNLPVAEVEQAFVDLGNISVNKVADGFKVKNIGNHDLVIKTFTTDNPVFKPAYKKEVKIKSGKEGNIKFSATGLKKGEHAAQVYLSTNDPLKPLLRFSVKVVVN